MLPNSGMLAARRFIAASVLLFALPSLTWAGSLRLEPLSIELTGGVRNGILRISNHGANPVTVQVRTFEWKQLYGDDVLTPTTALMVSPPIQEIPGESEQLIRIQMAGDIAPQSEQMYRLVIDQLPDNPGTGTRVAMLLRYSIPVTASAGTLLPPDLRFRADRSDEILVLEARNTGGTHARLTNLQLMTAAGRAVEVNEGLFGYVLAGGVRRWIIELAAQDGPDRYAGIVANVDGKPRQYDFETSTP